jgi:aminoglycoside phosphotransferase (APT) family kinase protein
MSLVTTLADAERLTPWLDENVPELGDGPLSVGQIHNGTSNVVLTLDRGGGCEMILRRPPEVPPPGSEKAVLREARVLSALNGTQVPHPYCHAVCADADVIGAPFYVMERVPGWSATLLGDRIVHPAPFDQAPSEYGIAYAVVDGLVALANVDFKSIGLEGFGKPDNFLERQVDRWEGQIRSYPQLYGSEWREVPGYAYSRDWLRANIPDDFRPGVIHGDVGTPNALFAYDRPARLNALIDWELSTIADPLIDLAWFTGRFRDEQRPDFIYDDALYNVANLPTRQEMARYYAAGTGRDMANFDFYCILAAFKCACILEYKVAQSSVGMMSPDAGKLFDKLVRGDFARAETLARARG